MTEDYGLQFQSIQAFYEDVVAKVGTGNSNQVSLRELKNTQLLIDQMLTRIQDVSAQGVDIDRLMLYQNQFMQLNREFDYAAKSKVRKEEFEARLTEILRGKVPAEQSSLMRQAGPEAGPPPNMPPPRMQSFPPPTSFIPGSGMYIPPPSGYQVDPYSRLPPPGSPRNSQALEIMNQIPQFPQPMPVPLPNQSAIRNPSVNPWQNPVPQTFATSNNAPVLPMYSQQVVFPSGRPMYNEQQNSNASPTQRIRKLADPWNNTKPWSGPDTVPPNFGNTQNHPSSQSLEMASQMSVPTMTQLPSNNNLPHHVNIFPPMAQPVMGQAAIGQPIALPISIQSNIRQQPPAPAPNIERFDIHGPDPWQNTHPWSDEIPFVGQPSFGAPSSIASNSNITKVAQNEPSSRPAPPPPREAPPPREVPRQVRPTIEIPSREAPSSRQFNRREVSQSSSQMFNSTSQLPPIIVDVTQGDPWQNRNPWSSPPTIIAPSSKRDISSKISRDSSPRFAPEQVTEGRGSMSQNHLTDSIYGKLYNNDNQTLSPPIAQALKEDIRKSPGQWQDQSMPGSNKPGSSRFPSPSFPGPDILRASQTSYTDFAKNDGRPPAVSPLVIGGSNDYRSPNGGLFSPPPPVVLETKVVGPPILISETFSHINSGSNFPQMGNTLMIPQSVAPPSTSSHLRGSGAGRSYVQKLTADEEMGYRRKLDELFSLPARHQNISFKSELSLSKSSRSKSPFKKKKFQSSYENTQAMHRLQRQNEELRSKLQLNAQMINQNTNQILRKSQAGGVLADNVSRDNINLASTNIEKYMISNEILQKENQQIKRKILQLEEVIEELAKENMQLKEMERSAGGQRSAGTPPARTPLVGELNPQGGSNKKDSSSDEILRSLGGGQYSQPKIRPVEYVHFDGPGEAYGVKAPQAQMMRSQPSPFQQMVVETSIQNIPMRTPPPAPPRQVVDALTSSPAMLGSQRTVQPSPLPTGIPSAMIGFSNTRFDASNNMPSSPNQRVFMSMHNASNYNNTSLWINDQSILENNDEQRRRYMNPYILPPTTNDLNKVNALSPDYEIKRNTAAFGGAGMWNPPDTISKRISPTVMPPFGRQQAPLSTEQIQQNILGSALRPMNNTQPVHMAAQVTIPQVNVSQTAYPVPSAPLANQGGEFISNFSSRQPTHNDIQLREERTQRSFDTFKLVESVPDFSASLNKIDHASLEMPPSLQNTNSVMLTRNKVAFFKKSLVILKNDPKYEIAFKRSELERDFTTVRLIFYVNNKTNKSQHMNIQYEYEPSQYQIRVPDKLNILPAGKQARQEVTVTLQDNGKRPHSFIICHFEIGSEGRYDILLPVLFFKFQEGLTKSPDYNKKSLTIIPNRQFSSPHAMYSLMPMTYLNDEQQVEYLKGQKPYKAEITVVAKSHQSSLRMDWFQGTIKITGDERWVDVMAWLLADIRL